MRSGHRVSDKGGIVRRWEKRGLIFVPAVCHPATLTGRPTDAVSQGRPWMVTHAALPVPDRAGDRLRVYFCSRDELGRAQIGWFDADLRLEQPVLGVSDRPVIGLGPAGTFDDRGATSSWVVDHRGRKYQFYTGWSLGVTVPFYLHAGLATSDDGGRTFQKISQAPLLDRCDADPYLTASPCVLIENDVWRMWYVSGVGWQTVSRQQVAGSRQRAEGRRWHAAGGGRRAADVGQAGRQSTAALPTPEPIYHIKYAESTDGIRWKRTGLICIDFATPAEHAISRPWVIKDGPRYRMWFASRGVSYRLGYAESDDGLRWERMDRQAGLEVSPEGWDSEMIAYPAVVDYGGERWMLYNGNDYGRTGIGAAVLK